MTFQYEEQVPRVHVMYSIGAAYKECHQQIPEDKQEQVSLVVSQYLQDPLLLRGHRVQNKPFRPTVSSTTVLFSGGVKWVPQFVCSSKATEVTSI